MRTSLRFMRFERFNAVEMQAIRKALRDMCASIDFAHGEPLRHGDEDRLASYGLPASVIAWVLEGEQ